MSQDGYEVGYGKPPKSGQFKKGQSGNPKGRPKKERDCATDIVERLLFDERHVLINGNKEQITAFEAIVMRQIDMAMKGDNRAAKQVMTLMEKYHVEEQKIRVIQPYIPSRAEFAEYYKDELSKPL